MMGVHPGQRPLCVRSTGRFQLLHHSGLFSAVFNLLTFALVCTVTKSFFLGPWKVASLSLIGVLRTCDPGWFSVQRIWSELTMICFPGHTPSSGYSSLLHIKPKGILIQGTVDPGPQRTMLRISSFPSFSLHRRERVRPE